MAARRRVCALSSQDGCCRVTAPVLDVRWTGVGSANPLASPQPRQGVWHLQTQPRCASHWHAPGFAPAPPGRFGGQHRPVHGRLRSGRQRTRVRQREHPDLGHLPRGPAAGGGVPRQPPAHRASPARLHTSQRLNRSAQGWTEAMVRSDSFTHGSDFAARITAVGFVWSMAGENIATGFSTPAQVIRGWMASTAIARTSSALVRLRRHRRQRRSHPRLRQPWWDLDAGLRSADGSSRPVDEHRSGKRLPLQLSESRRSCGGQLAAPAARAASSKARGAGLSRRYHSASSAA